MKSDNFETNNNLTDDQINQQGSHVNDEDEFTPIPKDELSLLANPAAAAFSNALDDFKEKEDRDILIQIHNFLLMDGSQSNGKILERLHELIPYMKNEEFYDAISLIFIDISHFNQLIQEILIRENIFEFIDWTHPITVDLVFNICDQNKAAYKKVEICEKYKTDPKMVSLSKQFK